MSEEKSVISVLKVEEILQCGDQFLLRAKGDIIDRNNYDILDLANARFRCEVGTTRKSKKSIGKKLVQLMLDQQEYGCLICFSDLRQIEYHVDHLVPISLGGTNSPTNLCILCAKCNLHKSNLVFKSVYEMRSYIMSRRRCQKL